MSSPTGVGGWVGWRVFVGERQSLTTQPVSSVTGTASQGSAEAARWKVVAEELKDSHNAAQAGLQAAALESAAMKATARGTAVHPVPSPPPLETGIYDRFLC